MPPHTRFAPFRDLVFSPRSAAIAGLLTAAIVAGCMGHWGDIYDNAPADLRQSDKVTVPAGKEIEVHYATPYAAVPTLETLGWHLQDCVLTEEKATHFRIRNHGGSPCEVHWTARGQPAGQLLPEGPPPVKLRVQETEKKDDPPVPPVKLGAPQ